jgi:glycosyltransferase involved in cell wall biosynthesis
VLHETPRVLVAHDYVTQRGGAERVVLSLLRAFPGASLLTSIYDPDATYPEFAEHDVRTLWVDKVPAFRRDPRRAMPFLAHAFSSGVVRDVDVVVCSSSGWAHGLRTAAPKIVYCHTPARWLYETADYLPEVPEALRPAVKAALPLLRRWDARAARSVHTYLANSSIVRDRIARAYGRQAALLHPPAALDPAGELEPVADLEPGYLLVVSRKRRYKHVEDICEAVEQTPSERLVVVGGLPDREDGRAWSPRLRGATGLSDAQMRWLYANAAALVAMSHEDFGLTPVEAYSFGTPAVLLRAGGYLDSSIDGRTCTFVDEPTVGAIRDAIARLRALPIDSDDLRRHADAFSEASFQAAIQRTVCAVLAPGAPDRDVPVPRTGCPVEPRGASNHWDVPRPA